MPLPIFGNPRCRWNASSSFGPSYMKKINTVDVLQRKLYSSCLNPSICVLYMEKGEDLEHLFLNGKVINYLWNKLFSFVGDFANRSSIQAIGAFLCSLKPTSSKNIIKLSGGATFLWSIWNERNNRTFEEKTKFDHQHIGRYM